MNSSLRLVPPALKENADRAFGDGGSGGPPYDGDMDRRVEKLEQLAEKTREQLTALEKDVAVIKSNYATKTDISDVRTAVAEVKAAVAQTQNKIIVWVVGAIFLAQLAPALPAMLRAFGWLK